MEAVAKEESLPPGFRFHPTDEELVAYYLSRKISDSSFTSNAVTDVDLNKCEPWDLPAKAKMGEKEWYFFSLRDRKYPTGLRTNRATDAGYWKTTGKDKEIFHSTTSELAGMKKTLVFYKGRAPKGEKTNWVMHEYRIQPKATIKSAKDEWVVCRVFKKTNGCKKFPTGGSVRTNPFHVDVGSAALSSLLHHDAFDHVNVGRSYGMCNGDLMDLSRALRAGSTTHMNQLLAPPPFLQEMGLNLNLPTLHPAMPLPMNGIHPQTVKIDSCCTSSIGMVTNVALPASETRLGSGTELGQDCTVSGFQQIYPCQGLGGYWPAAPY